MSTWKMDWKENDIVKAEDMNRIEENIHNAQETLDTKLDTSGDGSNLSSKFTETSIRENVNSGDSLMTIMGKIKKWFSDLKPLAFKEKVSMEDLEQTVQTMVNNALQTSSVANNLTTINEKMVLGAPMGKELSERISELNQNLNNKYSFFHLVSGVDLDALNNDNIVLTGGGFLHAPNNSSNVFTILTFGAGHAGAQIAIDINGIEFYYRILASSSWYSWIKLQQ